MPKEIINPPDGAELIDEAFYVWKTRYGLFNSMTKEGRKCSRVPQKMVW